MRAGEIGAGDIKTVLNSNYQRLACACHCLSTALKHTLPGGPGDKGESEELQALNDSIENVKALVRYVRKSGLHAQLSKTLVQENDTRWNSLLMMIESVVNGEEEVKELLSRNGQIHPTDGINFGLLRDLVAFLQPLKSATKALEGDSYPTIHKVVMWQNVLLQRCQTLPFDSQLITQLKARLKDSLHEKFPVTVTHKLALFLHPQYKSLRKLTIDDRQAVLQMARDYINVLKSNDFLLAQNESSTSNRLEIHSLRSIKRVPT